MNMMSIDEYINSVHSKLDSQLSQFGLTGRQQDAVS